jgi:nucleotide-binding universal stress UspA family protein
MAASVPSRRIIEVPSGHLSVEGQPSAVIQYADNILVQAAVIVLGSSVSDG